MQLDKTDYRSSCACYTLQLDMEENLWSSVDSHITQCKFKTLICFIRNVFSFIQSTVSYYILTSAQRVVLPKWWTVKWNLEYVSQLHCLSYSVYCLSDH